MAVSRILCNSGDNIRISDDILLSEGISILQILVNFRPILGHKKTLGFEIHYISRLGMYPLDRMIAFGQWPFSMVATIPHRIVTVDRSPHNVHVLSSREGNGSEPVDSG